MVIQSSINLKVINYAKLFVSDGVQDEVPNILFPENEIVTEPEPSLDEQQRDETEAVTKQETDSGYSAEELEKMALKETKEDKHFLSFKDRIGLEPEQVSYKYA